MKWVLQESGYLQSLEDEATLEAEGRIRNLEEFLSAAAESESLGLRLSEFLDRITLAADADQVEESAQLSLMTIHCAKGLEFPFVFVIGMEEDVFPNRNARETPEGLEEERRLFYVAITRAQRRLTLSAARRRRIMGTEMLSMPSRFLRELPAEALTAPIRWGTELYQSGEGVRPGSSFTRGARRRLRGHGTPAHPQLLRSGQGGAGSTGGLGWRQVLRTCRSKRSGCFRGGHPGEERPVRRGHGAGLLGPGRGPDLHRPLRPGRRPAHHGPVRGAGAALTADS